MKITKKEVARFKPLDLIKGGQNNDNQRKLSINTKMEVLKEQVAAISRQLTALKIDNEAEALYVLYLQVGYMETTQILLTKVEQELNRIQGYFDGVKQYIELLKTTQKRYFFKRVKDIETKPSEVVLDIWNGS